MVYSSDQSTERPTRRHTSSKARSSISVSRSHSSMKLGREIGISLLPAFSGGANEGSYGTDGSQRTP